MADARRPPSSDGAKIAESSQGSLDSRIAVIWCPRSETPADSPQRVRGTDRTRHAALVAIRDRCFWKLDPRGGGRVSKLAIMVSSSYLLGDGVGAPVDGPGSAGSRHPLEAAGVSAPDHGVVSRLAGGRRLGQPSDWFKIAKGGQGVARLCPGKRDL